MMLGAHSLEQEGDERLAAAVANAPDLPPELRAPADLVMAYLRVGDQDRQKGADAVVAARRAWEAVGDPDRRAECCWLASTHALIDCDLAAGEEAAREGLELAPSSYHAPLLHTWLAWTLKQRDQFEEAERHAVLANELAGKEDPFTRCWTLGATAALAEDRGDWALVERTLQEQMDLLDRHSVPAVVGRGGITEHNALIRAILGRTDEALALARTTNEIFSTRDNRGLRLFFPMLHRGDPKPGDTEKSLRRHYERLRLPPLEGAADALVERLEEMEGRLNRLGRPGKADDCRRAITAVKTAVGLS
jgi:tetratricopeptide (TPR) repeat protein